MLVPTLHPNYSMLICYSTQHVEKRIKPIQFYILCEQLCITQNNKEKKYEMTLSVIIVQLSIQNELMNCPT